MSDLITRTRAALARGSGAASDFDLNPDVTLAEGRRLRPAAVLAPIIAGQDGYDLILTKRSSALKHHPGQIAFPGGKQDAGDATIQDAALREANEEIGLPRDRVEILGTLPPHQTVTGYQVTPVIAMMQGDYTPLPELGEVSEIFEIPLANLINPSQFRVEGRRWQGRKRFYYTVPYGPYYVWGATARILRALAERMS